MPQNPNVSREWQSELGENWEEIHSQYLHTLGNLTLTGYNPELSDRPFIEKRDMPGGFKESPIRLNGGLARLDRWDENAIKQRATTLAKLAIDIWQFPVVDVEALDQYRAKTRAQTSQTYTLADHPALRGEMLELFEQLRRHILNLDASVNEEILKVYIAYKTTTNFVDVAPQVSSLVLTLNMKYDEIFDPKALCRDISNIGKWGNGDVEVRLSKSEEIADVMALIMQSFEKHAELGSS